MSEASESDWQERQQQLEGLLQQFVELQKQAESLLQEGQPLGTDSTQSPEEHAQGDSNIDASLTDVEFVETAARSLSKILQNGPIRNLSGSAFDTSRFAPLGPGTSIGCITDGNYEEFEKAYRRAEEESDTGEVWFMIAHTDRIPGLTTRAVEAPRIQKAEDSNPQMPAEDVTSAGDEEAGNEAPKNKWRRIA